MTVDRSYSEYEAIRTYHDRGMMKWGAFATAAISEAQKIFGEEKLIVEEKEVKVSHSIRNKFSNNDYV